jgi:hypothetical protein
MGPIPISARPSTYPYSSGPPCSTQVPRTPTISSVSAHTEREKVTRNTRLVAPEPKVSTAPSGGGDRYYFPSRREEAPASPPGATPPPMDLSRPTPVTPVPDSAALLAALCNTVERLPPSRSGVPPAAPADMLHAYLTERALQDVRIKQHQVQRWRGMPSEGALVASTPTTPLASPAPSLLTPTLSTNMSAMLLGSPMKEVVSSRELTIEPQSSLSSAPPPLSKADNWNKAVAIGQQHVAAAAAAIAAAGGSPPQSASPGKPKAEFMPPSSGPGNNYGR